MVIFHLSTVNTCDEYWEMINHPPDDPSDMNSDGYPEV
jgi:hypothetical protein